MGVGVGRTVLLCWIRTVIEKDPRMCKVTQCSPAGEHTRRRKGDVIWDPCFSTKCFNFRPVSGPV